MRTTTHVYRVSPILRRRRTSHAREPARATTSPSSRPVPVTHLATTPIEVNQLGGISTAVLRQSRRNVPGDRAWPRFDLAPGVKLRGFGPLTPLVANSGHPWRSIRRVCAWIWAFEGKEALSKSMALLY